MKYGYFDDLNKEYVIETPRTPLPWINYLGTNGFFSLISKHLRRLLLLQGRKAQKNSEIPIQQYPCG